MFRKLSILTLTTIMVILILVIVPVALDVLDVTYVFASRPCDGRDKFVQHAITHKCKCLPEQAVAPPWHIVDGDTCPIAKEEPTGTNTPFQPIQITYTPNCTATAITKTKVATLIHATDKPIAPIVISITPNPTECDICGLLNRWINYLDMTATADAKAHQ